MVLCTLEGTPEKLKNRADIMMQGNLSVLTGYLSGALLKRIMFVALILTGLMEVLALLEQTNPILARHLGLQGVLVYALLHLPLLFSTVLPMSVMLGSLICLTQLTIGHEISILRAAGLSTPRLVLCCLPVTLGLGVGCALLDEIIVPHSEVRLSQWWNRTSPAPEDGKPFWFRYESRLVHSEHITKGGAELLGVSLYDRSKEPPFLKEVILAERATYERGQWVLHDVRTITTPGYKALAIKARNHVGSLPWAVALYPADMIRLAMDSPPRGVISMLHTLLGYGPANTPDSVLKVAIAERLLLPVTFTVMLLFAVPVVYIPPRTESRSWLPVQCLGLGLLFVIVQGMLRALGIAGTLPVLLATLSGIVIFSLIVGTILLRMEEK